jgi:osmotically-inducible protein OsmY
MSQKKKSEEEALESALSPIVNRLIDKNFESSGDKIASQMAPLIGGAIREQIKSQKDDIVDALYPVMGNMISKFVTKSLEELLNKINAQIQNGLSAEAIKRKIKAKLKGVSETELLLEENSFAKITAALLIHKESGMLLAKAQDENAPLNDADMLASMMTAIRSFVNEWVDVNAKHNELAEIEYGGNKIIIEASGSSYLAVIVEGAAYTKTYNKIRTALESITLKYSDAIQEFEGDYNNLPKEELEAELAKLLQTDEQQIQEEPLKKGKHPLLYILPLLLLGWFAYSSYKSYIDTKLQDSIVAHLQKQPLLSPFKIDVNVNNAKASLSGVLPYNYYKELAQEAANATEGIKELQNNIVINDKNRDPLQIEAKIAYLIKGFNITNSSNVSFSFTPFNLKLFGKTASKEQKEALLKEIKKIKAIQNIEESIEITKPPLQPVEFKKSIYFKRGSTKLDTQAKEDLNAIIKEHNKIKKNNYTLTITSYSDMIGNVKSNRAFAKKRIDAIIAYLKSTAKDITNITYTILDTPPPGVNVQKEPQLARRIDITLKGEQ